MIRRMEILAELGLTPVWRQLEQPEPSRTVPGQAFESPESGRAGDPNRGDAPKAKALDANPGGGGSIGNAGEETGLVDKASVMSMDWGELRQAVAACTACMLHQERKQAVLGVGDERADWLIVGEGPGAEEDARGEPFVGPAGKLLDNMLRAIGLARGANVYIANVVKCRPPANRTPSSGEAETCAPYLDRQIELVQPRLIIALGKAAAHRLLGKEGTLGSMRATVHAYRGIPLIVTYHPAYLLRNMTDKSKAWEDLCFAVETMSGQTQGEGGQG